MQLFVVVVFLPYSKINSLAPCSLLFIEKDCRIGIYKNVKYIIN